MVFPLAIVAGALFIGGAGAVTGIAIDRLSTNDKKKIEDLINKQNKYEQEINTNQVLFKKNLQELEYENSLRLEAIKIENCQAFEKKQAELVFLDSENKRLKLQLTNLEIEKKIKESQILMQRNTLEAELLAKDLARKDKTKALEEELQQMKLQSEIEALKKKLP